MNSTLGQWKKIFPHLSCLLARLLRYILRHISRYAPEDVPCRQTNIQRNLVELFFSTGLSWKQKPPPFLEEGGGRKEVNMNGARGFMRGLFAAFGKQPVSFYRVG
jgi:hypothetical protein